MCLPVFVEFETERLLEFPVFKAVVLRNNVPVYRYIVAARQELIRDCHRFNFSHTKTEKLFVFYVYLSSYVTASAGRNQDKQLT